jgi:hypothetical protein
MRSVSKGVMWMSLRGEGGKEEKKGEKEEKKWKMSVKKAETSRKNATHSAG